MIFRRTFRTITENWFAFNENVFKPLAKSVLIPLGLTAAASTTDAAIQKNILRQEFTSLTRCQLQVGSWKDRKLTICEASI